MLPEAISPFIDVFPITHKVFEWNHYVSPCFLVRFLFWLIKSKFITMFLNFVPMFVCKNHHFHGDVPNIPHPQAPWTWGTRQLRWSPWDSAHRGCRNLGAGDRLYGYGSKFRSQGGHRLECRFLVLTIHVCTQFWPIPVWVWSKTG